MAEQETKFIKLNKNVTSQENLIFATGSKMKMLLAPSKYNPYAQCLVINAKDENNLPYPTDNDRMHSIALKKEDYVEIEPVEKVAYSVPFGLTFWGEEADEPMDLGLDDAYAQKDYKIDTDGNIITKEEQLQKQASLEKKSDVGENHLTDSQEDTSMAFKNKVEGQDDPSYAEPWHEDTSEKPATPPILGELTGMIAKTQELRKKLAEMEDNNLTESNKDITTDFDTNVGGAGEVKDVYKEDTSEKPWKDENLGQTSAKKETEEYSADKAKKVLEQGGWKDENKSDSDKDKDEKGKKKTAMDGKVQDVQKIKDMESNTDAYEEDDFPLTAQDLGLTEEQEAEVNKSLGIEAGDENHVS